MSTSEKEIARLMQQRLEELGYDVKLTHCYETLARMDGYKNRHHVPKKQEPLSESTNIVFEETDDTLNPFKRLKDNKIVTLQQVGQLPLPILVQCEGEEDYWISNEDASNKSLYVSVTELNIN